MDPSAALETYLPEQLLEVLKDAGQQAQRLRQRLYLVGGAVRDLLLGRPNLDLDLVVERDTIALARQLANKARRLTVHARFGTAKLNYGEFSLDLATARRETYARPGALPAVQPGTMAEDLFRRDFTINAMALSLTPESYGEFLDPYHGRRDLEQRLIRVLHPQSFVDDATRIWRAIRYEQRLGFRLESETLPLLRRDIDMLDAISGDRLRHELELALKEDQPETVLARAYELGVLQKLHPSLKGNGWLAGKFQKARKLRRRTPVLAIYLSLLVYRLSHEENEAFLARLNVPSKLAQVTRETLSLRDKSKDLEASDLPRSQMYEWLRDCSPQAIRASIIASDSPLVRQRFRLFLSKLRRLRPSLNGDDLRALGLPPGPQMGQILKRLHAARLDGEVSTREEETALVQKLLTSG